MCHLIQGYVPIHHLLYTKDGQSPYTKHPFSRSYRVILPSSLDLVILRALVYST